MACPFSLKPALPILLAGAGLALFPLGACRQAQAAAPPPACTSDNLVAGKAPVQQRDVTGDPALVTNETVVLDGASWDSPAGVRLEGTAGSLTYDLGKPTRLSAFLLQADANDSYKVTGSPTGEPARFTLIAQAANVVDRGPRHANPDDADRAGHGALPAHGRRGRRQRLLDLGVRRVLHGPDAVSARSEDHRGADGGRRQAHERRAADLTPPPPKTVRSVRSHAGADPRRARCASGAARRYRAQQPRASGATPPPNSERMFPLVLLLFLGSGCAALMYEIIWFQMLQLVLGSSAISIAVLLGTFMAGMCIGSLALPRYVRRERHPLRVYAVLELGDRRVGPADAGGDAARAGRSTRRSSATVFPA